MTKFKGFKPETIKFLQDLEQNNNKVWFEQNKESYEKFVLEPLKNLVDDLSLLMCSIDPEINVTPVINKTISTIYRDTRYANNKHPFKNFLYLKFKRQRSDWKDCPAFYMDFSPEGYRFGMGFFRATPQTMAKYRELIDSDLARFEKLVSKIEKNKNIKVYGEKYKRIFDKTKSAEMLEWYQRKNLFFGTSNDIDDTFFSEKLVRQLADGFEFLKDFYYFLWKVKQ